ncbi:MAG: 7-cyano-7-deazaguanine synthase QueC [Nitrospirae bacterium]|nr:7-cyano-7-deazaguanine synthase QueC [Nitrospirota bacterium]
MAKKAVVLLSGGVDSATTLAVAKGKNYLPYALTFDYGQRHAVEIEAARKVAAAMGAVEHLVVKFDLRGIGGSALTADIPVPKNRDDKTIRSGIPVTYVPARNTIFLSVALGWAETLGARDIFIGVNALDYSGYPDCRAEFVRQFESLAAVATKAGVEGAIFRVHAPLIELSKAEIIRRGSGLGVDFSLTHSCYDPAPTGAACGACDSCILRRKGFEEAGLPDPAWGSLR